MAKPGKKKSGLHKNISSVLKGVFVPQGVRNWRPPDTSEPDISDDSSKQVPSNISSVFKSVPVESGEIISPPSGLKSQNHDTEVSPVDIPDDAPKTCGSPSEKHDCPEELSSSVEQNRQFASEKRVAYYHDPKFEILDSKAEKQLREQYLSSQKRRSKTLLKVLALSVPVLIAIIIIVYKYCFPSSPAQ